MRRRFRHPQVILLVWAGLVLSGVVLSLWGNVALVQHVRYLRAHDPMPHLTTAETLVARGSIQEAWAELRSAMEKAPKDARVFKVVGDLHFRQKEWIEAVDAYRSAIDEGSDAPGVFANTLWALIELSHYPEAIAFGEDCIRRGLTDAVIPRYIAEAYLRSGDRAAAIPFLEKALERYTNDLYLLGKLLGAYRMTGDTAKAQALEQRITALKAVTEQPREMP